MNIETNINIGDRVYVLKKITRTTCPICSGTGKVQLCGRVSFDTDDLETAIQQVVDQVVEFIGNDNVRTYDCPECKGSGTVKVTGQKKYKMVPCRVDAMQMTIGNVDVPLVILYSVTDEDGNTRKLVDSQFYCNREDAEKQLFILNLDRKLVDVNDVRIPNSFSKTIPCNEKLNKRFDEWRTNRKLETEIYVDDDMNLFDGYTSYLVYKMFGMNEIPVVVWPKKNNKEDNKNEVSV